jgi:hypothetical protein
VSICQLQPAKGDYRSLMADPGKVELWRQKTSSGDGHVHIVGARKCPTCVPRPLPLNDHQTGVCNGLLHTRYRDETFIERRCDLCGKLETDR